MNIAILVYDISLTGGAERVALNLAEEFSKYYNTTMISVFNENKYKNSNFETVVLSPKTVSISKSFLLLTKRLRSYLKDLKIDILLSVTAGVVTLAVASAVGLKTKVVYSEHSNLENKSYGRKHQFRQLIGSAFSDCTVTLTERDKKNFQSKYNLSSKRIASIPNWYDNTCIVERKYNCLSKKIISVGRLEYVKGYDYLLKIAKKIYNSNKDWHWDIYGDGSLHNELQKTIDNYGLNEFVTLKGNVGSLDDVYNDYAFLVMTSRYEGLPMVLLEAKAHKLPIVSFNCPTGPAEIVSDGINGLIVKAYDIDEMCTAINQLINDKSKRVQFSQSAQLNMDKYSKQFVLKKWKRLFSIIRKR